MRIRFGKIRFYIGILIVIKVFIVFNNLNGDYISVGLFFKRMWSCKKLIGKLDNIRMSVLI